MITINKDKNCELKSLNISLFGYDSYSDIKCFQESIMNSIKALSIKGDNCGENWDIYYMVELLSATMFDDNKAMKECFDKLIE